MTTRRLHAERLENRLLLSAGDLDTTFGINGMAITDFRGEDIASAMAIQDDEKILVVGGADFGGSEDFALARYLPDGSPDKKFGSQGKVLTDVADGRADRVSAVAVQPDGKIVAAGITFYPNDPFNPWFSHPSLSLTRYRQDGRLDKSFGDAGKVAWGGTWFQTNDVLIEPNGGIVICGMGAESEVLVRYDTKGKLDASFGENGIVTLDSFDAMAVNLDSQGRIVIGGKTDDGDFAVARFHSDGNLDPTFGGAGWVTTTIGEGSAIIWDLAIQQDGRIVAAGAVGAYDCYVLARYNADGSLDTTFDGDGVVTTLVGDAGGCVHSLAVQPDGKIVAAGYTASGNADWEWQTAVARYDRFGGLDSSFGNGGIITDLKPGLDDSVHGMALQHSNGKVVVAGTISDGVQQDFFAARLLGDGSPLPSLSINDREIREGDSGAKPVTFTVTLSGSSDQTVTAYYATKDGSAKAAKDDYVAATGVVTFAPGETDQTITVDVLGDTRQEKDEKFFVNLTSVVGAAVSDDQGKCVILNDDFKDLFEVPIIPLTSQETVVLPSSTEADDATSNLERGTDSVSLLADFQGQYFTNENRESFDNPDTQLAAGPEHLVEVVNARLAFFNKAGDKLSEQRLDEFFEPVGAATNSPGDYVFVGQSRAAYDELAERFILVTREWDLPAGESHLLVAVSDDADPEGDWEMHRLNLEQSEKYFFESPGLGWDADGIYVTGVMRKWYGYEVHHSRLLTFDKGTLLDGNPETLTYSDIDLSGSVDLLQPAAMHGADPGDPMYFVHGSPHGQQGSQVSVVEMTDKLAANPRLVHFNINVPNYEPPPSAIQPEGRDVDLSWQPWQACARILTASWRGDRLVAAHNVESDGLARVRWYEISTADVPSLTQVGEIDQGPDVDTYYPSMEISAGGDLGMTFMQSSADEFVSMYVTGQKSGRTGGVMETPLLVKAGEDVYRNILPWGVDQNVTFAGYWGGIAVDPVDDTFWAAHQYALPIPDPPPTVFWANWGTWIASFSVTGSELAAPWVASSRSPFVIREEPVADFVATEKESAKPPAAANGLPLANGEEPVSCLQRFTQPRTSNNAKTIETTTLFARIVDLLMSEFE